MTRCVATNPAGARCIFESTHGNSFHLWADSVDRFPYWLGTLQNAVEAYLAGRVDRGFLARTLAETEPER